MTEVLVYLEINHEHDVEVVGKEIISYVRNNFPLNFLKALLHQLQSSIVTVEKCGQFDFCF